MKGRVAQHLFYDRVRSVLADNFRRFEELTGRHYDFIDTYGMEDAKYAIVGLGSSMDTTRVAVDHMRNVLGWKVGLIHVTSMRPFPGHEIVRQLAKVKAVTILERVDEPLASSNPLAREIKAAFADAMELVVKEVTKEVTMKVTMQVMLKQGNIIIYDKTN
jgi:pyruvate-ferredoxin/flavodoxin oxidoreductase